MAMWSRNGRDLLRQSSSSIERNRYHRQRLLGGFFGNYVIKTKQSDVMEVNRHCWLMFALRLSLMVKHCLIFVALVFTYGCDAQLSSTNAARGRPIQIKLEESKAKTDSPKKSVALTGFAGEPVELRCLASSFPIETGMRVNIRFIVNINGKRMTAAVGVGSMRRSEGGVDELVFPLRLPAKPGLYRLEIFQNQALLLTGDFRIEQPAE
jgi:hypothetical protein